MEKLIDDIIELVLDDMDCHHEREEDEYGRTTYQTVEYNLKDEKNLRGKIVALIKKPQSLELRSPELPKITEEWAGKKALAILTLIKQGQDEDLEDPALSLHYLGLSLDIVDSIIELKQIEEEGK